MANTLITGNDLLEIVKSALERAMPIADPAQRQAYLDWAAAMAPLVTKYSVMAAQGQPRAEEMLAHIRGTGVMKSVELVIANTPDVQKGFGDVAVAVALTVGSVIGNLITRYGAIALGLAL